MPEILQKVALMAEERNCVSAAVGTGVSGSSIEGQAVTAVVTVLLMQGLLVMSNLATSVVMFQRRSLREGIPRCRTKSFGRDIKEQTTQLISREFQLLV